MANRRMFSMDIIDTDKFLEMPVTTQALYFHLGMRADDDGFVSAPNKITKLVNCSTDDLRILASKGYIIPFDSGVVVLTHWRKNNRIQSDRYKKTQCTEELALLNVIDGTYSADLFRIQDGSKMDPQVSIGKYSIDQVNKYNVCFEEFWKVYPRKKEKAKAYKCYQARLKDGYSEEELLRAAQAYSSECQKNRTDERYIKLGATFLGPSTPFTDYLKGEQRNEQAAGSTSSVKLW